jgi:mono/diheme cytochrome c family protein
VTGVAPEAKARPTVKHASILTVLAIVAIAALAPAAFAQELTPELRYQMFCATCHGEAGKGDGPSGGTLSTKPRDFTDCAAMKKLSDDLIFRAIKDGGASVGLSREMPGWAAEMGDAEIKGLVTYVRSFCK